MKIILIDSASLFFRSIFNWERQVLDAQKKADDRFILPAHYTYMSMVLSSLKKIGVDKEDLIIVCEEGHSWRKNYLITYKSQRKTEREKHTLINWDSQFKKLNDLHKNLDEATNWHFIRIADGCEADDIISTSCRFFPDNEIVIVSSDGDLKQLVFYKNVKYFSVNQK